MKKLLLSVLTAVTMFMPVFAQTTLPSGGTGWSTSTIGDLLVGTSSTLRYSRLPAGTAGYVLQASSTSPFRMSWVATSTLGFSGGGGGGGSSTPSVGAFGLIQFASTTATYFDSNVNLSFSTTSEVLSVGTTGTNAGLSMGYFGTTGQGAIWNSTLTRSQTNHGLLLTPTITFLNAATSLGLSIGASVKATLSSVGNFGIGTTTPTDLLHVAGAMRLEGAFKDSTNATGTVNQGLLSTGTSTLWSTVSTTTTLSFGNAGTIQFASTTAGQFFSTSTLFWDTTNNRLGIGTTAPQTAVHLFSTVAEVLRIQSLNSGGSAAKVELYNDTGLMGQFSSLGSLASGANLALVPNSFNVTAISTGGLIAGASNAAGVIRLFTGGAALTNERVRIDAVGNIGFGTTTGGNLLTLASTTAPLTSNVFVVGTSSPLFSVTGGGYASTTALSISGAHYDSAGRIGSNGDILSSTGTSTLWTVGSSTYVTYPYASSTFSTYAYGTSTYLTAANGCQSVGTFGFIQYASTTSGACDATSTLVFGTSSSLGGGPRLQIGSSNGIAEGWYFGSHSSALSGIWVTSVTPTANNYSIIANSTDTVINGATQVTFDIGNQVKGRFNNTGGHGFDIVAGTAATNVNALNITQTWNNAAIGFDGLLANFTDATSQSTSTLIRLQLSGVDKFLVNKAGNVGIGTSTPISLLSVMASSTPLTSPFISFNSTTSPIFNILTNGNVGIGTSTPIYNLDIAPQTGDATVRIFGANSNNNTLLVGNTRQVQLGNSTTAGFVGTVTNTPFLFTVNNSEVSRFSTLGFLGIGTSTPVSLLSLASTTGALTSNALTIGTTTSLFAVTFAGTASSTALSTTGNIYTGGTLFATRPRFTTSIDDANGVNMIGLTATPSAVNSFQFTNAATTFNPSISATGTDSNIGINFVPKGTGRLQSNGVSIPTISSTDTLTNKRITARVQANTSVATDTPDWDQYDIDTITAQAAAIAFAAPAGTCTQGQKYIIRIKDNGTARAITFNAIYRAVGVTLPTTTVISKTLYMGGFCNTTDTKVDIVAVAQE